MDKIIRLLKFLSASFNAQIQLRVNEHLRAALFAGSILAISLALYRGWINTERAADFYTISATLFGLAIHKTGGGGPAVVVQQVPRPVQASAASPTPLQQTVSAVVTVPKVVPLGEEFDKEP